MYAVVRTGGKQVRLKPGLRVRIERIPGKVGDKVKFDQVLLIGGDGESVIGRPTIAGAKVQGVITAQDRSPKITVFKMKRRKGYRRKQGHRQEYTEVEIGAIKAGTKTEKGDGAQKRTG